ncbi:MAG: 5-(carboxyamino)imidazole ribonucleotide synthase [Nitrospinota bacterium]
MNIGVLGGGQLARMLAQAGQSLEQNFMFLCPNRNPSAGSFGTHLCAPYEDPSALKQLSEWSDVVTYEFENIPLSALELLQEKVPLHPSSSALSVARDRLIEKNRFHSLGIPTAKFASIECREDLNMAIKDIGLPAILKTRTQGYDGKGQARLQEESNIESAWKQLGNFPCIIESMVLFSRELSIIAARDQKGNIVYYPVNENHHRDGILRLSINRLDDPMQAQANTTIKKLMDDLNYVGVMALELFQVNDQLFANEFAPRVHNSGHLTIEGAPTSQFENHLRAICNLPLGKTTPARPAAMVNLIGSLPEENQIRTVPGATPHFYCKAERPGRKVGHITLTRDDCSIEEFDQRLVELLQLAGEPKLGNRRFLNKAHP